MDRITWIKQQLLTSPQDSFLLHALALEYIKLGQDEEARTYFENLLSHDPAYVGSYYHLGKTLERLGQETEAAAVYEKGMEMARAAGEARALGELRSAFEELTM
jgi:Tfp pilus assembly protein PilF